MWATGVKSAEGFVEFIESIDSSVTDRGVYTFYSAAALFK